MPSGGCRYTLENRPGTIYCSRGTVKDPNSSGLYWVRDDEPLTTVRILTCYLDRPFSSVWDVAADNQGRLWFTHNIYGYYCKSRPKPSLPCQIYCTIPYQKWVRAVADGFRNPLGIALSPDNNVLYVSDTGLRYSDGAAQERRSSTIYAFDIKEKHGFPYLTNRRVFALINSGVAVSLKSDGRGYVYASCWDGVEIFSPGGIPVGVIRVPGATTYGLCCGPNGQVYVCAGQRLWLVQIPFSPEVPTKDTTTPWDLTTNIEEWVGV
ncbi:hypothetical protein F4811DRAFT_517460 [Daldinia bambusicola]|nr:hypothetical protein F4811DRAFT_517460 [Daldinia bambusicola]